MGFAARFEMQPDAQTFSISAAQPERRRTAWNFILLGAVTLAVWFPSILNDFICGDDLTLIVRNTRFNPPTWSGVGWYWAHPLGRIYQPISTTLWATLAKIGWSDSGISVAGHLSPMVFHAAQVFLQIGSTLIVFNILRRALKNEFAALAGALVFAVHPIQTEAVAYVGVLNHPLAGFFSLAAIDRYLTAVDPNKNSSARAKSWAIGSVALALGMLAKPLAVVAPPIALCLDLAIYRRGWKKSLVSILPWIALTLPFIWLTSYIQPPYAAVAVPFWYRFVVAGDTTIFYFGKLFWPWPLALDYGRSPQWIAAHGASLTTFFIAAALIAVAIYLVRDFPLLIAAIAIFLIGFAPNSGLIPFDYQQFSTVSDRYLYLSMLGPALAIGFAVTRIRWLAPLAVAILIALAVVTEIQISYWHDSEKFCRHNLAVNPDSWWMENNLAIVIANKSPDEALSLARSAVQLNNQSAACWNTLGTLLMVHGDRADGADAFRRATELDPNDPEFARNLKRALTQQNVLPSQ